MANLTNIENQVDNFNFFKFTSLGQFLQNFFQLALILGTLAAFLYLIWGGIQWILSGGNQERAKTAKSDIGGALTGLIILAVIWVLWRLVLYFLGLSSSSSGDLQLEIPTP